MDSMKSLNTSLPGPSPLKQQAPQTSEQLIQAFKSAALTVTQLYKTATDSQSKARSEGYQDALNDILAYLDKEDIGLNDGEGWKVRGWATERLEGKDIGSSAMESDDDVERTEQSSSPVLRRTRSATYLSARNPSPTRAESDSVATSTPPIPGHHTITIPQISEFTFRSSHAYPQDSDMSLSDLEISDSRRQSITTSIVPLAPLAQNGITVSRPARSSRLMPQANRHTTRGSGALGRGSGQKRKINFGEFFDVGNLGHGKEGFGGGGKRSKFA